MYDKRVIILETLHWTSGVRHWEVSEDEDRRKLETRCVLRARERNCG